MCCQESVENTDDDEVTVKDTELMNHLLEIVILIWTTVAEDIKEVHFLCHQHSWETYRDRSCDRRRRRRRRPIFRLK